MSLKVGDTVQLKSGGPDMTVTRIGTAGGEPMVWCAWFEGTKDAYGLFPPDALKTPPPLESAEALTTSLEPQPKALLVPESTAAAAAEPQQAASEPQLTEVDKPPPEPQRIPEPQLSPEPVEAKRDSHPAQVDREARAERKEQSLEHQIR